MVKILREKILFTNFMRQGKVKSAMDFGNFYQLSSVCCPQRGRYEGELTFESWEIDQYHGRRTGVIW